MKAINLALVIPLILSLSACVVVVGGDKSKRSQLSSWEQRELDNREAIAQLQTSHSMQTVLEEMGTPDFDEKLNVNERAYRVLYYRTQRVKGDGITTKDECTPLVFYQGQLTGWGESEVKRLLSAVD